MTVEQMLVKELGALRWDLTSVVVRKPYDYYYNDGEDHQLLTHLTGYCWRIPDR